MSASAAVDPRIAFSLILAATCYQPRIAGAVFPEGGAASPCWQLRRALMHCAGR